MFTENVEVRLQVDPAGVLDIPARPYSHLVIHVGPAVEIHCERAGQAHKGLSVHGDVDIVPAGVPARWILKKQDTALIVRVSQGLLLQTARSMGLDSAHATLRNRFQIRDAKIEHLAWALKTEIDHGFMAGRLYSESIGTAMACQLLQVHSVVGKLSFPSPGGAMPGFRLRRVLAYIEENLGQDLSLASIAAVSGLSISRCQRAFRNSVGLSIHQYVIRRRVEAAKSLLLDQRAPVSEVASSVGFAHQSHLAYHMRRLLGVTPLSLRNDTRNLRRAESAHSSPNLRDRRPKDLHNPGSN